MPPNGHGSAAPPHWIGKAFEPVPAFKMALILLAAKRRPLHPAITASRDSPPAKPSQAEGFSGTRC